MNQADIELGAELTKINFLLENLYAITLHRLGASHDTLSALENEMARQFELPGTVYGPDQDVEGLTAMRELASHRLAMFVSDVQARMRSATE